MASNWPRPKKTSLRERVLKTAQILQLDKLLQRKPRELSGGQRQRVAMGRAMAREPDILLFDEPLSNLDASLRVQMRNEIARLHGRLGSTMIYVTHDQVEAMTLADKIVVLNGGRIEQVGSPRELYEHPASRFVAGFLGSPKMNFLPAHLHTPGETSQIDSPLLGMTPLPFDSAHLAANSPLTLGIRPEHVSLKAAQGSAGIVVVGVEYLGSETYVHLESGEDEPLICRCEINAGWRVGDRVELQLAFGSVHLFDADGTALRRHPAVIEVLPEDVPQRSPKSRRPMTVSVNAMNAPMPSPLEHAQQALSEGQSRLIDDYRPDYHLAPVAGWMNDPNGVVFFSVANITCSTSTTLSMPNGGPMYWGGTPRAPTWSIGSICPLPWRQAMTSTATAVFFR
nr:hypothetical protein GCM10020185_83960 [Pseudomonas brassicacearum subsp. brassicacearum]